MDQKEVILIVDDTPENLQVLGGMLESEGCEVLVAANGAAALENAMAIPHPDLILLDIMMPDMDGYAVCRRLKAEATTRLIPVIFVSGLQDTLDKVTAFQVGGVDYITKPFHAAEVLARVRTHLELRRQRQLLESVNDEVRQALAVQEILNHKLIEMNEKLRISEHLKSRFLATTHQAINNPLGSIMAMAGQIAGGGLGTGQAEALATMIHAEAFDLDFQMRNIFLAAELEAGDTQPLITRVDVRSMIQRVIQTFSRQAQCLALDVRLETDDTADTLFDTDVEKLSHILANLLANAIKFSPPSALIRVCCRIETEELILTVEDEGPGIPEESRDEIFERFRQLDTGSNARPKGHGLGLSVVKALLDLLGGQILLSQGSSGGARFTVHVPRPLLEAELCETSADGTSLYDDFEER